MKIIRDTNNTKGCWFDCSCDYSDRRCRCDCGDDYGPYPDTGNCPCDRIDIFCDCECDEYCSCDDYCSCDGCDMCHRD